MAGGGCSAVSVGRPLAVLRALRLPLPCLAPATPPGLRGQHLGRAAERLPRPGQLLCRVLPRIAFGHWVYRSPGVAFLPQKPPQGHSCCPVPVHSADHEQILSLDQLLQLSVLMEALCPPNLCCLLSLGKVQSLPVCRLLLHSVLSTV